MKLIILKRKIGGIPLLEIVPEEHRFDPLPTVFFYHGWRSNKELVLTQSRKIAAKNMRVIAPDALNHGERRQEVSKIPSLTFWQSIQGNLAEFAFLKASFQQKKLLQPNQVAVGGVSMGGMTTCMLLASHPELVGGACLMGTPNPGAYLKRVYQHAKNADFPIFDDYFQLMSWTKFYDLNLHPETLAGRPLLFWHGTKDPRIPYEQTADFYQKIAHEAYGVNTQFFTGLNEGHLVQPELMGQTANFFGEIFS